VDEESVKGWSSFCKMTGMSRATAFRKRDELRTAGVIYYTKEGRPPRKVMRFWPSLVKRWTGLKSVKNEIV